MNNHKDEHTSELKNRRLEYVKRMMLLTRHQYLAIAFILFLALLLAGANAVEPLILKYIFDGLSEAKSFQVIIYGVIFFCGLAILKELCTAFSNWLVWRTRLHIHLSLLDKTVERLHRLPHHVYRKEGVGAIMTRLDRSIQGLIQALNEISFNILPAIVYIVIGLFIMFKLQWQLTLVLLAFAPLPVLIADYVVPRQRERERNLLNRWAKIYGRFNEVLSGIITVRSFAMEDVEKRSFLKSVKETNKVVINGVRFDSTVGAIQNLTVFAARICGIGFGGYLVIKGQITVGTLIAFLSYIGGLFTPIQGLTNIYRTIQTGIVSMEEVFKILDSPDFIKDSPQAICPPIKGHIKFNDISFNYEKNRSILEGVNLEIKAGEVVAIVGPSGAGKSTLMALLQRLYDPTCGSISFDGVDIRDIQQKYLRSNIGIVMQDALLFNESIYANIAYGKPQASRAQVEAAAKTANAHDFVQRLEEQYNTFVGERGSRLSGGERQRIAIARAILKDPPVLIFDEATSALDAETESLIHEALEHLIKGRTTFIIAHRLSTVVNADRILVLKNGTIIEQGNHKELMAHEGYYSSLVKHQTKGLLAA